MKFNLDLKSIITLATILFALAGFYYTTISDLNSFSLQISALESENHMQQKRLDTLDRKTNRLKKRLDGINK